MGGWGDRGMDPKTPQLPLSLTPPLPLHHNPVQDNNHLPRTPRYRLGFAPLVGLGIAAQILLKNVGFHIVRRTDDDDGENAWIRISLNWGRRIVGNSNSELH